MSPLISMANTNLYRRPMFGLRHSGTIIIIIFEKKKQTKEQGEKKKGKEKRGLGCINAISHF